MTGKDIFKITANLVIVYLVGGLILAAVYAKTSPIIFRNNENFKKQALKALVPEADDIRKAGEWTSHEKEAEYYIAKKGNDTIGYVVQSFGKGYSSFINVLIAVDKDFKVKKISILSHGETPGLGDEIMSDSFQRQFKGKDFDHLKVVKVENPEYVQAISGATISSRAVTEDSVKNGVDELIKVFRDKKAGGAETEKEGGPVHVTSSGR